MRFQELCIVGPHAPSLRSDCRLEETLLPATTAVLPFRKNPESAEGGPVGEGRAIGRSVITAPAGRRGRKQGTLPQRSLIRTAASPAGTTVRNVPVGRHQDIHESPGVVDGQEGESEWRRHRAPIP